MWTHVMLVLGLTMSKSVYATVDLTLVSGETGSSVVEAVTDKIQEACQVLFSDDRQMLRRIAYVESKDGEQAGQRKVSGGIWRIEKDTFKQIQKNVDPSTIALVDQMFNVDWISLDHADLLVPLYSGLAARLWLNMTVYPIPGELGNQADYWAFIYNPKGKRRSSSKYLAQVEKLDKEIGRECSSTANILVVMDSSGSIGTEGFESGRIFIRMLVESLDLGEDKVHLGLMQFSSSTQVEFEISDISREDALDKVDSMTYIRGGTVTGLAVQDAIVMFSTSSRQCNIPKVLILVTDGNSNGLPPLEPEAEKLHMEDITVFALGVGSGVNQAELELIGSDPDCVHVYNIESYELMASFTAQLKQETCKAQTEIDVGNPGNGNGGIGNGSGKEDKTAPQGCTVQGNSNENQVRALEAGTKAHYKAAYSDPEGLTVTMDVEGEVDIYASHTARNPSSAINDYSFNVTDGLVAFHIEHPGNVSRRVRRQAYIDVIIYITVIGGGSEGSVNLYKISLTLGDKSNSSQVLPPVVVVLPPDNDNDGNQAPREDDKSYSNNILHIVLPVSAVVIVIVIALAVVVSIAVCKKYGKQPGSKVWPQQRVVTVIPGNVGTGMVAQALPYAVKGLSQQTTIANYYLNPGQFPGPIYN